MMKRIFHFLRITIAGGVIFLVPFVVLVLIIDRFFALLHRVLDPPLQRIGVSAVIGPHTESFILLVVILLLCFLAGCLARTALAKRIVSWLEITILSNIPGYEFLKGMGEHVLGAEQTQKWQVVIARFNDSLRLGFLVERLENDSIAVFIPNAPNPRAGTVYFLTPDRIRPLEVTPTATLKCLKRLGAGSNKLLAGSIAGEAMK